PVPLRFFFKAEDGIRDFHVTGVQTCALPIYRRDRDDKDKDKDDRARPRLLEKTAEFEILVVHETVRLRPDGTGTITSVVDLFLIDRKSVVVGEECMAVGTERLGEEQGEGRRQ